MGYSGPLSSSRELQSRSRTKTEPGNSACTGTGTDRPAELVDQSLWASKTRSTHVVSTRPDMKSASRKIRR